MKKIRVEPGSEALKGMMGELRECYCDVWRQNGGVCVEFPGVGCDIVGKYFKQPTDLSTLADEVASTICDTKTKEAFKKFAELLDTRLKKLEEK